MTTACYGDGFGYGEPRMTNRYKYRLFSQAELDAAVYAERARWIEACNTVSDGAERERRPGVQTVAQVRKLAIDGPNAE